MNFHTNKVLNERALLDQEKNGVQIRREGISGCVNKDNALLWGKANIQG
jgi:hypothetical protein